MRIFGKHIYFGNPDAALPPANQQGEAVDPQQNRPRQLFGPIYFGSKSPARQLAAEQAIRAILDKTSVRAADNLHASTSRSHIDSYKTPIPLFLDKFYELPPLDSPQQASKNQDTADFINLGHKYFKREDGQIKTKQDLESSDDFRRCQEQYKMVIDEIVSFTEINQNKIAPPLLDTKLGAINRDLNEFRDRLFNLDEDFYSAHKPDVYGSCKEMLHEFADHLKNEDISLQKRMDAVLELAPKTLVCAGGLHTELSDGLNQLKNTASGLIGATHTMKIRLVDALIFDELPDKYLMSAGNEVHFANALLDIVAERMGVPKRNDPFMTIGMQHWNNVEQRNPEFKAELKNKLAEALTPTTLSLALAEAFHDRIKEALTDAGIDIEKPLTGESLTKANETIQNMKDVTLNATYGNVPMEMLLKPVGESYDQFQITNDATLTARHFLLELKKEGIVNCEEIKLAQCGGDQEHMMMMGGLFWLNTPDGCDNLGIEQLEKIAPDDLLSNIDRIIPENKRERIFEDLARKALASAPHGTSEHFPDALLAKIFEQANLTQNASANRWVISAFEQAASCNGSKTMQAIIGQNVGKGIRGVSQFFDLLGERRYQSSQTLSAVCNVLLDHTSRMNIYEKSKLFIYILSRENFFDLSEDVHKKLGSELTNFQKVFASTNMLGTTEILRPLLACATCVNGNEILQEKYRSIFSDAIRSTGFGGYLSLLPAPEKMSALGAVFVMGKIADVLQVNEGIQNNDPNKDFYGEYYADDAQKIQINNPYKDYSGESHAIQCLIRISVSANIPSSTKLQAMKLAREVLPLFEGSDEKFYGTVCTETLLETMSMERFPNDQELMSQYIAMLDICINKDYFGGNLHPAIKRAAFEGRAPKLPPDIHNRLKEKLVAAGYRQ